MDKIIQTNNLKRNVSQVYLSLVPLLGIIFGFGVGYISYKIYLPIWIINVCLMVTAAWFLGGHVIKNNDAERKHFAAGAFFLIVPWIIISMFFGLGPPPDTHAGWVATATEQQARYLMLVIAGLFIAFGFSVLREKLKDTKGGFYSLLGYTAIMIAIPLFIINMIYWGTYLVELFKIVVASSSEKMPEWFLPTRKIFGLISLVEVALTYLAIAAFAASLRAAGWLSKTACRVYIGISFLGFLIMSLSFIKPLETVSNFASIPAIPFLMPYFMGINLLRRAGNKSD